MQWRHDESSAGAAAPVRTRTEFMHGSSGAETISLELRAEWSTVTDELKSPASRSLLEELSVQFSRAGSELERHLPVLEFGAEAESPGRQ